MCLDLGSTFRRLKSRVSSPAQFTSPDSSRLTPYVTRFCPPPSSRWLVGRVSLFAPFVSAP
jgi:hypothetical protein